MDGEAVTITLYYAGHVDPVDARRALMDHILPAINQHPAYDLSVVMPTKLVAQHMATGHMIHFDVARKLEAY